jgi:predicted Zn-dependent protease
MILNENEAKNLLTKVLSNSKADSAIATLNGSNLYNIRFARNSLSTNGFTDGLSVSINSNIGRKSGSVTTNRFDDASIKDAVARAEEIARLSPENKEFMPPLGPQTYSKGVNYSENTAGMSSGDRTAQVSYVIEHSAKNNVICAGYQEDEVSFSSIMSTTGLFAYSKESKANLSATVRTSDGSGSGRFEKLFSDVKEIEYKKLSDHVIERSKLSINPETVEPGRYTVILEPSAAADMLSYCLNFMGSRGADEGRSFFSKSGGGNLIGEKLAGDSVNIYSNPVDLNAPSTPFVWDGEPRGAVQWFENGVLKNLHRNRFWAEKTSALSIPYPSNILMKGNMDRTLEDMISSTDSAILVTRFWYIRTVDPKTMLLTGLTRDGVFEVKNGRITRPVRNFRFNESPMNILSNIIELGRPEKAVGAESGDFSIFVPPLKVANFNFSSLSDAI